ncbi:MAG: uroporphyrinogen decarboxylase family protein [Caldicoprobacterales bacterium]|jgi:uroporphyrinogen decarboxylase|nr:hypothetical protein [Clostridiales bacterium]
MATKLENFNNALNFIEPERVPFAIWNTGPFCTTICGADEKDYYLNAEFKLKIMLQVQDMFPDAILIPGPWPDFGTVLEASVFGSEIVWNENAPPDNKPVIHGYSDILKLGINIGDSLLPIALRQYEYMWKHMDRRYIDENGYLDGIGFSMGPLEVAAALMDFSQFLIGFYDEPELMHKLIDMTTEAVIHVLHEQQKINGPLKRLAMGDHLAHNLSSDMFMEFCFPYYKRVFDEFPGAIKIYHNEGNILHIAESIPDFGANIVHYGVDTKKLKGILKGKVTIMGNLDPITVMCNGTPELVYKKAMECLMDGAEGGGMLLSSAGGMAPNTPAENVRAALRATEDFANSK